MRAHLFGLSIALALAAPSAAETVTFQSGNYDDFRQILAGDAAPATVIIAATLEFPVEKAERHPAVVIVHTIAGYQDSNEGWHAAEFRKAGFATLTYESPAARIMREAPGASRRNGLPWGAAVAEAFAALRVLALDPRIDPTRIVIVGFSFGGEIAHLSALEALRVALVPEPLRFVAHVAFYPAGVFGVAASTSPYTGAPVLMLLGDKDDNLPIAKIESYLAYARAAGSLPPVEVSIYVGGYHAWTVSNLGGASRFYGQYASTKKCPLLLLRATGPALLVDGQEKPMDPDIMRSCLANGWGYTMAYDAALREKSLAETLAFIRKRTPRPN